MTTQTKLIAKQVLPVYHNYYLSVLLRCLLKTTNILLINILSWSEFIPLTISDKGTYIYPLS